MSTTFLMISGLFLLGIGGEALIRGGISIGRRLHMSPLVVGMIIVGFGTSMPELAVSLRATLAGSPAIAVGNVVGSNIANILLILAVAALLRPIPMPSRLMKPDGFVLLAACLAVPLLGLQGTVPRWQGGAMLGVLFLMITAEYVRSRRQRAQEALHEEPVPLPAEIPHRFWVAVLLVLTGLAAVIYGAELLVAGATAMARALGVSESFIGLSIVAVGTSLPELAGSVVATWRGHSEVAYGNVVGSSIFNVLCIFGAAVAVGPITVPAAMIWFDSVVMIAASVLMLVFVATGRRLSRNEGLVMLACYVGYIALRYKLGLA
ncbi:MAG: calcium/sodium antiporter [Hyphomicrobiaceae bacterium]|nr:calcium/sodium antiporter [Hyphomicrobiaceae bacterium]